MVIEVSGRQTGKTTRLINDLVEYRLNNPNHKVCVVSLSSPALRHRFLMRGISLNNIHFKNSMEMGYNRYYVDEFDYINPNNLRFYDNSYFTTSIHCNTWFTQILLENNQDKIVDFTKKSLINLKLKKFKI